MDSQQPLYRDADPDTPAACPNCDWQGVRRQCPVIEGECKCPRCAGAVVAKGDQG